MIVSFSGIDGAGKTTQINRLIGYCHNHNIKYIKKWSKARGTPGVEFIKSLVRRDKVMTQVKKLEYRERIFESEWKKKVLYILSMLDLCWYWGIYYRILKYKYNLVILDRYIWDTYVEVSTEFKIKNLNGNILWKLAKLFAVTPDISILLVIPTEESLRRDLLKGEITTDALELKQAKFDYYIMLKDKNCWNTVLDSMKTIDYTANEILQILNYTE